MLEPLLKEEKGLFILDVNEPAIAHRLACRLDRIFRPLGWDVDCEYNRDGLDGKKVFEQLHYRLLAHADKIKAAKKQGIEALEKYWSSIKPISVYPDIIIHHRGKRFSPDNLLVIEVKKTTNCENREIDAKKLSIFTSSYSPKVNNAFYQWGLAIEFTAFEEVETEGTIKAVGHWFRGGVRDNTLDPLAAHAFELFEPPEQEE